MSDQDQGADFIASFMDDYFAEAEDHLTVVRRNLLLLESAIASGEPPSGVVEELFRSFHSLKGLSAMVQLRGRDRLARAAHRDIVQMRSRGLRGVVLR